MTTTVVCGSAPGEGLWQRLDRRDAVRAVAVGLVAVAVGILRLVGAPWVVVVPAALVGLAVGCGPIVREAWGDVRHRRMSMELSMLIAIAAAAAIGEWVTALVVTVFVLAAEILEDLSMDRGRDALTDLMAFLPTTVQVRDRGGAVTTTELAELRVGQVVVIAPGASVPVDGTVVAGRSSVDQSRITGESLPVEAAAGSTVYAGSINQVGAIEVRAERIGAASSYGQIIDAVREAQSTQSPAQRLADRLAAWLVYLAFAAAALTFVATRDVRATISVIVVAGACGIAAGTPLAILAAIARAARTGAFVKGGTHMEALSRVDTVMFDKTGTLTLGTPAVTGVYPTVGTTEADLLCLAAAAESYTEHPLGQAIVRHAHDQGLPVGRPDTFAYEPGSGVTAGIGGRAVKVGNAALVPADPATTETAAVVHVSVDGRYLGRIELADAIRPSARRCVADLRRRGLRVVMLTGDHAATGAATATQLGIDDVHTDLLPSDKLTLIQQERSRGHRVAMVGDGVNDAPALAVADVGIAVGSGTAIARDAADVILISSDLRHLTDTVDIARRTRRIVMANFAGTLLVDAAGMLLAAYGILGPILAALVHVGSESAFILNSARLIPRGRPTPAGLRT